MRTDIYLQSRHQNRSPTVAAHEKAIGVLAATVLLVGALGAGALLLFDFALPLLGRAWRSMPPYVKQELIEACVLFGVIGAVLLCSWGRANRPRHLLAMAVTAAIIMPCFVLGYTQVSDVWRSIFRVLLGW